MESHQLLLKTFLGNICLKKKPRYKSFWKYGTNGFTVHLQCSCEQYPGTFCSPKLTCGGTSLLFPKGASPLTPCSRHFPFQCSYQGAEKKDEFCWPGALQADGCEGASPGLCAVSVAAVQDRNVYSLWDSLHPPLWKHLGASQGFSFFFLLQCGKTNV